MSNKNRSADEIVKALMAKADKETLPELLLEAVSEGAKQTMDKFLQSMEPVNGTRKQKTEKKPKTPVVCPVSGCDKPGIRPLRNFCQHHFESLTPKKRNELRGAQVEAKTAKAAAAS